MDGVACFGCVDGAIGVDGADGVVGKDGVVGDDGVDGFASLHLGPYSMG